MGRSRAFWRRVSLPAFLVVLASCIVSTAHPLRWASTVDYYGSRADRADFEIHHCVGLSNGVVYLQRVRRGQAVAGLSVKAVAGYPAAYPPARTILGVALIRQSAPTWSFWEVDLPLWPIAALSAVLPMRAYLRRRRLRAAGLCRACGYDLRGNVSGVCPECGTPVR